MCACGFNVIKINITTQTIHIKSQISPFHMNDPFQALPIDASQFQQTQSSAISAQPHCWRSYSEVAPINCGALRFCFSFLGSAKHREKVVIKNGYLATRMPIAPRPESTDESAFSCFVYIFYGDFVKTQSRTKKKLRYS